jgi:hypothetical protein
MGPDDAAFWLLTSLGTNIVDSKYVGKDQAIRKALNPVTVMHHLGYREPAAPVAEKLVPHTDLGSGLEGRQRGKPLLWSIVDDAGPVLVHLHLPDGSLRHRHKGVSA